MSRVRTLIADNKASGLNSHRDGSPRASSTVTATDAKNEFGRVLEKVIQGGIVFITRHDEPKAVLMSLDEFNALKNASRIKLDSLTGEFDALLARMQTPAARAGMKAAFDAPPKQMGNAAVRIARKSR